MTSAIVFGVLQTCIVTHESNGIDIITALILNDISPLCRYQMEMVLQLKVSRCSLWLVGSVDRRLTLLPVVLTKLLKYISDTVACEKEHDRCSLPPGVIRLHNCTHVYLLFPPGGRTTLPSCFWP